MVLCPTLFVVIMIPAKKYKLGLYCFILNSYQAMFVYRLFFSSHFPEVPTFQEKTKALFGNLMDEGGYLCVWVFSPHFLSCLLVRLQLCTMTTITTVFTVDHFTLFVSAVGSLSSFLFVDLHLNICHIYKMVLLLLSSFSLFNRKMLMHHPFPLSSYCSSSTPRTA